MILGIDEVGRGCWAGPLLVGAVVLGGAQISGLTDSKALRPPRRAALAATIEQQAAAVGLGWVAATEVDEIGLAAALRVGCRRAVAAVDAAGVAYHEIIIDGTVNLLAGTAKAPYVSTLKRADALIGAVSAASIVAKQARDTYMQQQAAVYPEYGFERHVGYGTEAHRAALAEHGPCPLHRLSVGPVGRLLGVESGVGEPKGPDPASTRAVGDAAEAVVAAALRQRGHRVLAQNWRTKWCEIDIVSQWGDVLYMTEVKYRRQASQGDGLAAITAAKQQRMRFAAELFLAQHATKTGADSAQLWAAAVTGAPPRLVELVPAH